MDWLVLAVGEPAPFFSVPAVGYLSGAARPSWGRPCCLLAEVQWAGSPSSKVGWVLMLRLLQGPAPNRSPSRGCSSSWVDLDLIPSSVPGKNSIPHRSPDVFIPSHRSASTCCPSSASQLPSPWLHSSQKGVRLTWGRTHYPLGLLPAELSPRVLPCRRPSL